MSYQVIARKWRPQSFDEVSGQQHVTTALRNAIRSGRIPHAILLTGPRGVGKTTLARLIARCLNCEKGPTDQPCGSCPPCVEITEGRSTDVQEIDAASRTGVDDMREVIESIRYAAAPGKHRIFIVDEVHMLSTAAFNALLKTLEEPPPRSLFIFATTNPEKIPFTVLSRCQRHDLRRIALKTVSERLAEICAAEGIEISAASLAAIAREGEGSMRDAQTLLDQIVAYSSSGEGEKTIVADETVAEVLDLVDTHVLRAIVTACLDGDARAALEGVARATSSGSEPRRIADALLELLRDLVVLRLAPEGEGLFEGTDEERAELAALAGRSEPARLRRMFRALVREIEDLSWAPQPRSVLEMAVIRLATMPSGDDVGQLLTRLDQLERRLSNGGAGGGPGGGGGGSASGRVSDRGPRRRVSESTAAPSPRGPRRATEDADPFDAPPAPAPSTRPEGAPAASPSGSGGADPRPSGRARLELVRGGGAVSTPAEIGGGAPPEILFERFRARALDVDRARFASLSVSRLLAIQGATLRLGAPAAFHVERLRQRGPELEAIASELFERPIRIEVELTAAPPDERGRDGAAREQERRQRHEALNSEAVNLAIEVLGAEIVEIRPLGGRGGADAKGEPS